MAQLNSYMIVNSWSFPFQRRRIKVPIKTDEKILKVGSGDSIVYQFLQISCKNEQNNQKAEQNETKTMEHIYNWSK